ncbi:hypothetical protein [Photorhabdus laumondii]
MTGVSECSQQRVTGILPSKKERGELFGIYKLDTRNDHALC